MEEIQITETTQMIITFTTTTQITQGITEETTIIIITIIIILTILTTIIPIEEPTKDSNSNILKLILTRNRDNKMMFRSKINKSNKNPNHYKPNHRFK